MQLTHILRSTPLLEICLHSRHLHVLQGVGPETSAVHTPHGRPNWVYQALSPTQISRRSSVVVILLIRTALHIVLKHVWMR
jgi:hypothetical protein